MSRVLCWFSCGSASAVAAKMAIEKYGVRCEVVYCDTLAFEHPDNSRFMADVERWLGTKIKILKSERYADIFDVFRKTRWLVGPGGARCTTEMKKVPRKKYQRPDDLHVFGFTAEERGRVERFREQNAEDAEFPLFAAGISKRRCHEIINAAGIAQPAMYRLGYENNNCIGCVKGGKAYWNRIRKDFPDAFERMAKVERELGATILDCFLDELDPAADDGQEEFNFECGVLCPDGNAT